MEKNTIIQRLQKESCFVLYRFPKSKTIHGIIDHSLKRIKTIQELQNIPSAFIFAPFNIEELPICVFSPTETFEFEQSDDTIVLPQSDSCHSHPSNSYRTEFNTFHQKISDGHFSKLVLARSQTLNLDLDSFDLFMDACCAYPDTMVYMLHTPDTGTWIGASPEILLEGNCIQMHTIALAGTMTCSESTPKLSEWSVKNKEEQKIVTDYIRDCIRIVGELKDEWGPYSYKTAHLAHLRSDLYFRLDSDKIPEMITILHPTPAICGIPKKDALQCILNTETKSRSYYSGFFGWYEPSGNTQLYVNLRCLQQNDNSNFTLYAGGGILASSTLESEWSETENKMLTLLQLPSLKNKLK